LVKQVVDRAGATVCWYEEIDHQPPSGRGDPADVWAAAETVYLTCQPDGAVKPAGAEKYCEDAAVLVRVVLGNPSVFCS